MAETIPFEGIYYSSERVAPGSVIAPPYDVLSPAQQQELFDRDPRNIVRVILNQEMPGDGPDANRYTRAAACLNEWLAEGTLVQDSVPAYYEYVQRFGHPLDPQVRVERRTLLVALKLEPYEKGIVLPHEETHPKAKADRLDLMRATRANPEPIYGLYEDPVGTLTQALDNSRTDEPIMRAAVAAGADAGTDEHLLYRHAGAGIVKEVGEFMAARRVWIADGHHRYETGLNYQRERGEADPEASGPKPYDYLLIGLSAFEDSGLVVLPTHRLVRNVAADRLESLALQLERYFHVIPMSREAGREWIKSEVAGQKRFGLLHAAGAYGLVLRGLDQAEAAAAEGHCQAWQHLDVTILQTLVLDRTLGISWTELAHTSDVAYTRDADEAVAKVASGEFQIACLLQNPTVSEVRDVAAAGDKMPQKSTFFYPKLWSGIILRSLN